MLIDTTNKHNASHIIAIGPPWVLLCDWTVTPPPPVSPCRSPPVVWMRWTQAFRCFPLEAALWGRFPPPPHIFFGVSTSGDRMSWWGGISVRAGTKCCFHKPFENIEQLSWLSSLTHKDRPRSNNQTDPYYVCLLFIHVCLTDSIESSRHQPRPAVPITVPVSLPPKPLLQSSPHPGNWSFSLPGALSRSGWRVVLPPGLP